MLIQILLSTLQSVIGSDVVESDGARVRPKENPTQWPISFKKNMSGKERGNHISFYKRTW